MFGKRGLSLWFPRRRMRQRPHGDQCLGRQHLNQRCKIGGWQFLGGFSRHFPSIRHGIRHRSIQSEEQTVSRHSDDWNNPHEPRPAKRIGSEHHPTTNTP
jgi:hypothetical protein